MELSKDSLSIKLFADGADLQGMTEMAAKPYIAGLTTNPTLMNKAGISDYVKFAKQVVKEIPNKPISFEVFSDDFEEMKRQSIEIASWGENVYVKIPITNSRGESTHPVISFLTKNKVKVNVTALMTPNQVEKIMTGLQDKVPSFLSVFAGRIADTGRDPLPIMRECLGIMKENSSAELIWASPRELLNVFQADSINCHIITATNDILKKIDLIGKNLEEYSLETVKMFYLDAKAANFEI
jgi:transaldolase